MSFDSIGGSSVKLKGVNSYGNVNNDATKYFKDIKANTKFEPYEEIDYDELDKYEYKTLENTTTIDIKGVKETNEGIRFIEEEKKKDSSKTFSYETGEIEIFGKDIPVKTFTKETGYSDNKKNNTATNKIWSSFYGGSAKHTKDHLGILFNKFIPGSLRLDKYDRTIAYDKDGRKYKNGILDSDIYSESMLVKIRNGIEGRLQQKTAYDTDVDGSIKSKYGDAQKTVKDFLETDLDGWVKNSGLAKGIEKFNSKFDNWDNPSGSKNQYRVGQNWSYGSVVLDSRYVNWEGNVVQFAGEIGDENNYLAGEVDILHAEAQAGWELGPDHFVASASAEASLLHVEGSGKFTAFENEFFEFGAQGTVKADVAKVYANGKIGLGLYKGADGNTHLDAGIQASVGADLCSATASGTANLGLASVTGTATVKIGIGAQANIGFEDGKLNFHLGLALGVGVELGFSIDVNKGLNAVKEGVSTLYENVVPEPVKKVVETVVVEPVKKVVKAAKKVWDFVTSW